jgi:uncharacterized protein YecE (DUF72 family)
MEFDLSILPAKMQVGTSSFSTEDWCGVFYPEGLPPHEFLTHYARTFQTVEIDATWHFMPNPRTVEAWKRKVPEGFVFAAKVPKSITHEKYLVGCEEEWEYFLDTMHALGPRLGPLLFQFKYVSKRSNPEEAATGRDFLRRLEAFLPLIPAGLSVVVEVRNQAWLRSPLTDLLRARGVALALVDYVTMPRPARWFELCDPVTAAFSYVRFLGDHHSMDDLVAHKREREGKRGDWNEVLVDRTEEMREWIPILRKLSDRVDPLYVYFNNHYAGFAPGSIALLLQMWDQVMGAPRG